jgi:hypothetical protein
MMSEISTSQLFNCQGLCSAGTDDICHECQSPGLQVMGGVLVHEKTALIEVSDRNLPEYIL